MRFIYLCMAVVAISFVAVPVFHGISTEHEKIMQTAQVNIADDQTLSLEEIYALADDQAAPDPSALNDIATAAGGDIAPIEDKFSSGFSGAQDSALEDTKPEITEETL